MTPYIAPDGKLYVYKQYVNWEGYRPAEGMVLTGLPMLLQKKHWILFMIFDAAKDRDIPVTYSILD